MVESLRLHVLARLDREQLQWLTGVLDKRWGVACLETDVDPVKCARLGHFDVLLLDPMDISLGGGDRRLVDDRLETLTRALDIPLVLLCPVARQRIGIVLQIVRRSPSIRVVLWEAGKVDGLVAALEDAVSSVLAYRVLRAMLARARIRPTPNTLELLERLFRQPRLYSRAEAVIASGAATTTTLNKDLKRCGLAPFHVLRRAARVAHAFQLTARLRLSQVRVAKRVGCGSVDALSRDAHLIAGKTVPRLVRETDTDELLALALRSCCGDGLSDEAQGA